MKIANFVQFKIEDEKLKNIKGGMEIWCSVNVGFPDGSGFVNIGQCSGSTTEDCSNYGSTLCNSYMGGMGATSCEVVCTA
ncbi:MAG: hypothetical protein KIT62_10435 [Cyclobacteriaceae bacterium]|nr:hypothetical protein [Cyclobacteriaceae bacterium]